MTTIETTRADLAHNPPSDDTRDRRYAELVQRVKAAGLLAKRPRVYALRTTITFGLLAGAWALFFVVGNSWWQLLTALVLAFMFTQVGFLAHDAGHRQAFKTRRANDQLMFASGNLMIGIASSWWFGNHNRHHAHPNNVDLDPDIGLRYFAYHQTQTPLKKGIDRFVARYQHHLYFPLLCLLGFSLHFESVAMIVRNNVSRRKTEAALLFVHFAAYAGAIALTLPLGKAIVFVLVHQLAFGLYLGSTFAPNHKGMEMFDGNEPGFLDRQVLSSRNVRGNAVMSYLFGGLNHQIEHHLFPSMPRPNLVKVKPIVESFCAEVGLPYAEESPWGSFREVVAHFRSTRAH